jgi:hypothetical protein
MAKVFGFYLVFTPLSTYLGRDVRFGFVAVFRVENEVGIDENISVGYKDKRL